MAANNGLKREADEFIEDAYNSSFKWSGKLIRSPAIRTHPEFIEFQKPNSVASSNHQSSVSESTDTDEDDDFVEDAPPTIKKRRVLQQLDVNVVCNTPSNASEQKKKEHTSARKAIYDEKWIKMLFGVKDYYNKHGKFPTDNMILYDGTKLVAWISNAKSHYKNSFLPCTPGITALDPSRIQLIKETFPELYQRFQGKN
jgi:hypothetical protein